MKMRCISIIHSLLATTTTASILSYPQQQPIGNNPGLVMPPAADTPIDTPASNDGSVTLSDVLGTDRSINIFAGFTRDFANISQRFEDSSLNTTILAPINSAIMALPRKPWEDPVDYDNLGSNAYEGPGGEERAQKNMRRFVEAHVVPASPWKEGEKLKTLSGGELWWETKDGVTLIQPGGIEISSIASKVHNGEVWILKGVRNYAS